MVDAPETEIISFRKNNATGRVETSGEQVSTSGQGHEESQVRMSKVRSGWVTVSAV